MFTCSHGDPGERCIRGMYTIRTLDTILYYLYTFENERFFFSSFPSAGETFRILSIAGVFCGKLKLKKKNNNILLYSVGKFHN